MDRSLEQIRNDMLENIPNTEDKSENSFIQNAVMPTSIEFFTMYRDIEETGNKIDIENLEGEELERFIYQRTGIQRRLATRATGTVVISGVELTTIGEGLLVSASDIEFRVTEPSVISANGSVEVPVEATVTGSSGNVPVNTIDTFPSSEPGLIDVYNPVAITNGYDEENDTSLLARYYEKLRQPAKSGNKFHYEQWAKEVVGVGGVRVVPRFNGPLTMKVVIIDSNQQLASGELVQEVDDHIRVEMPFGVDELLVISATAKTIDISATLSICDGCELAQVQEDIKQNVKRYLQEIAFSRTYVSYARIGSIILDTDGVLDYSDLKLNNTVANVAVGNEEVAIMGVIE